MKPDKLGKILIQKVKDEGFAFYASPQFWLGKAAELNLAAQALSEYSLRLCSEREVFLKEPKDTIFGVFPPDPRISAVMWQTIMMAGFALENVFKATIIKKQPHKVSDGKLDKFHHHLIDLATEAEITLSELEERLCEIFTHATVCAGRYPTSNKSESMASEWKVDIEVAWPVYSSLYERCFNNAAV